MPTRSLVVIVLLTACSELPSEGESCTDVCASNLACVPHVGADHGKDPGENICERPHAMYDIIAYGERGENRRVDEALEMIDGSYRLPRFSDDHESLATVPYGATLSDGTSLSCTGLGRGAAHDCLVPDWPSYYGTQLSQYDRFFFYGMRMVSSLIYTAFYSPEKRLTMRYYERTHEHLDSDGVKWLRHEAQSLALAVMDSFVVNGHRTFALEAMPACYTGASGYQNPNAVWSPELAQWDPAMKIDERGRLDQAEDVPADCSGAMPYTFFTLRDSLWYPHAAAYRALMLANTYFLFRGVLSDDRRDAWLRVIRETGDALGLPSSYEPDQNHGITESAALIQLAFDFAALMPGDVIAGWMKLGRYRLNDLMVDTVFADGVQVEQSPMYHNYQLVLLLQIIAWMESRDLDLTTDIDPQAPVDYDTVSPAPNDPSVTELDVSPQLDPRAVTDAMVRASVHLAQPDGWIPLIGSSVPQQYRGYQDEVLRTYIDDGRPYAGQLQFFQSGGSDGKAPPDSERLTVFDTSGYVTMHSAFKPDFGKQTHVVFNAGLPYHKHSHPDALAVHLFGPDTDPGAKTGTPLLVDSGWFSYESVGTFFFKSTLAHNTVTVDGLNQCVRNPQGMRLDPYTEGPLPSCDEIGGSVARGRSIEGTWHDEHWMYQSARHTLYVGTTHRRAVLLVGHEILVVIDMLDSTGPHTFSQTWHLPPRVPAPPQTPAQPDGSYHVAFARGADDSAPLMSLHEATDGAALYVHDGDPAIAGVYGQGWYSTREEQAEPNAVVELRRDGVTTTAFASLFLLGKRAGQDALITMRHDGPATGGVNIELSDGKTIAIEIANLGDTDAETFELH